MRPRRSTAAALKPPGAGSEPLAVNSLTLDILPRKRRMVTAALGSEDERDAEERQRVQHVDLRALASRRVAPTASVSPSTPPMATA